MRPTMSDNEISLICLWVNRGAKLLVGSNHSGHRKIKVVRGPFGLMTKRFKCSEFDVQRLRKRLSLYNPKTA